MIKERLFSKAVVAIIVLFVGNRVIDEVLYEHYIKTGERLRAFFIRPYHYVRENL